MLSRLRLFLACCSALTLAAAIAAPSHAGLTPYDVPVITCESATLSSITLKVCSPASGAPAGLTIQWKERDAWLLTGWSDEGLCKLSLSGQPSLQHPGKSRWELVPGECEFITLGDINFDETGVSGTGCGLEPLDCSKEYVFRWFAHAGRGFGRSDWGGDLICSTESCPAQRCTYSFGYWKKHGGPSTPFPPGDPKVCNQAPVNPPDPEWPASVMSSGLNLGSPSRNYTASQLCYILNHPGGNRKQLVTMAHQAIAAHFNLLNGATNCPTLAAALAQADQVIGNVNLYLLANGSCFSPTPPAGCNGPGGGVPAPNNELTAYNEGGLCNPNCHGSVASDLKTGATPLAPTTTTKSSWGSVKSIYR